jgi:tetratricopeptide (TPR) repeat protein
LKLGAALRENRSREVLVVLDVRNRVDPESTALNHSTTVKALLQLGEKEAALPFARKAAEDAPAAVPALIANELLKAPVGQDIDYDLAVRLCEQALQNGESGNPVALSALARSYEGIGKPTEAVRVWRQMLALDDPAIDEENVRKRIDEWVR